MPVQIRRTREKIFRQAEGDAISELDYHLRRLRVRYHLFPLLRAPLSPARDPGAASFSAGTASFFSREETDAFVSACFARVARTASSASF